MISPSEPVALVMPTQSDVAMFMQALSECGFRRVTTFTSGKEAYEVCVRQHFSLFVTHMELTDINGIVLIQKLRATGNYGLEPHLFVCEDLSAKLLSVCSEHDLDYVLVSPFGKKQIIQKFRHLVNAENNLSEVEQTYRDAKSAFANGILDMSEQLIEKVLTAKPDIEKALLLYGDIKAKMSDIDGAQRLYKRALGANPKSATAAHKLAQLLMAQGAHLQAADMLNRLAELSPYNIRLLENAGLSNFRVERYDLAKAHMGSLSTLDEDNRTASQVVAQIKVQTGDFDGLVETLKKAHDEKEVIQFLNNAGAKLSQDNDVEGAIRMYLAALAAVSSSKFLFAIHYNLGIAYKRLGQVEPAKEALKKALKLKPDLEKAAKALADLEKDAA